MSETGGIRTLDLAWRPEQFFQVAPQTSAAEMAVNIEIAFTLQFTLKVFEVGKLACKLEGPLDDARFFRHDESYVLGKSLSPDSGRRNGHGASIWRTAVRLGNEAGSKNPMIDLG